METNNTELFAELIHWHIAKNEEDILFDYIFMFPLNLGFLGAALATALSPVVTMLVCSTHYLGKNNHVEFHWRKPSLRRIIRCCQLGVSAFFAEISSERAFFRLPALNVLGIPPFHAEVVELVDTLGSGSSEGSFMGVRVSPSAP